VRTINRQTTSTPIALTALLAPVKAWAKVAVIMIMSSIPSGVRVSKLMPWFSPERQILTHPLSSHHVRQPSEEQLTNQSADRGSDFDTKILVGI
jgi:hypothetical protein